jgi:Domain of unknown function (DUF4166)/Saccharopine dehydrogenase NADP binding domain
LRVLIVGGYGTFGGRLVRLLADDTRLTVLVAGRSPEKAQAFCADIAAQAKLVPTAFDRTRDARKQIAMLKPDILVDASGPFQIYGDNPYALVEASLAQRVHYVDLADAPDFVDGIARYDAQARDANIVMLSGVSTTPVLTTAVIRRLSQGLEPRSVTAGIAPSPFSDIGLGVVQGIASYAGNRLRVRRGGDDSYATALVDSRVFTIAPPGEIPLPRIRFSLVDTPDRIFLTRLWPTLTSAWLGAGPRPALWHCALSTLAFLHRWRLFPALTRFAGLFHAVVTRLRWGEHRGGMFVEVDGALANGKPVSRSWHMIADGDDGPFIPSMPAYAIVGKFLSGNAPRTGARACLDDLELEDFERLFTRFRIVTGVREQRASDAALPLYRRVLGEAWSRLPAPIRAMHDGTGTWIAEGRARVDRGRNPLARLIGFIVGFPKAGNDIAVSVRFEAKDGRETWARDFAGKRFSSLQFEGRGANEALACERFGPVTIAMALVVEGSRMHLVSRRCTAFGIPLPKFLSPRGNIFESAEDNRFNFHVEIGFAWSGLIARYRGWLKRIERA